MQYDNRGAQCAAKGNVQHTHTYMYGMYLTKIFSLVCKHAHTYVCVCARMCAFVHL